MIKKNCKEKFIRLFSLGLKPHSKGLNFSASVKVLSVVKPIKSSKTQVSKNLAVATEANIIIVFY